MGWRKEIKEVVLTAFGSKCCICGYDKCNEALEFHHLNFEKKDFSISSFKIGDVSTVVTELKKCVCVCGNCHRELHNNLLMLPEDSKKYNSRKSKNIIEKCNNIFTKVEAKKKKSICRYPKNTHYKHK